MTNAKYIYVEMNTVLLCLTIHCCNFFNAGVQTENVVSTEEDGIPDFTVLNKDNFVIVQDDIQPDGTEESEQEEESDHAAMVRSLHEEEIPKETRTTRSRNTKRK